jgi:two-component system, OmpR family, response regulator
MSIPLQRITYVEDEPDIRTIAELVLTKIGGFTLQVCESGQEAIDGASEFDADLILLDVMMPGMDGIETLQRFRAIDKTKDTPIVFMTAKAQRHETEYYRSLGVVGVIPKPFDPIELPITLNAIWHSLSSGKEERRAS